MRRRSLLAAPALFAVTVQRAVAQGAPLRLGAAGPGSAFLPYGEGLAAALGRAGLPVTVVRSTGSLQNLAAAEDDPGAIGAAFLGSAYDAVEGTPAAGGRRHAAVRALFPMYETAFQVAALRSSGIATTAGLSGRRVGAGPSRGPAETFLRALAEATGITPDIVGGEPADLSRAVLEGRLDALWQGAVVPIPSLVAITDHADAIVFGPDAAGVAAVRARLPYMSDSLTPAGTYRGQTAPVRSFSAWNFVVGNAALPDATAYALTATAMAAPVHAFAARTTPADAARNTVLPFHPGAARWFAEHGVPLP